MIEKVRSFFKLFTRNNDALSLYRCMCAVSLYVCIHTAMLKKPVVTEVRTPTNTWSGLGFSKSMPAETIKELRRANHVPYKPSMSTTFEVRHRDRQGLTLWHFLVSCVCYRRLHLFYHIHHIVSLSGIPAVLVSIQQPGRCG